MPTNPRRRFPLLLPLAAEALRGAPRATEPLRPPPALPTEPLRPSARLLPLPRATDPLRFVAPSFAGDPRSVVALPGTLFLLREEEAASRATDAPRAFLPSPRGCFFSPAAAPLATDSFLLPALSVSFPTSFFLAIALQLSAGPPLPFCAPLLFAWAGGPPEPLLRAALFPLFLAFSFFRLAGSVPASPRCLRSSARRPLSLAASSGFSR